MRRKHGPGAILVWTATLTAMLASVPALGHDPLKDEHDPQHGEHDPQHDTSRQRADLSAVRALVVSFRESGDDRYLDNAWALLEPALESATRDPETLIAAAFVAQSRHEFDSALQFIRQALSINNNNDEAWLLLASIHLVRGESASAATACDQLRNVPPLILLTCKARVTLADGEQQRALTRLHGVLSAVDTQHMPAEMLAWSHSVAGDLAVSIGDLPQALELYGRSLDLAERTQVRAALVDVLIDEARNEDALQALNDGARALPLLVRRLIVAKRLNRMHELQTELSKVQHEFEDWIANEDWLHAREMARFFIDVVERPDLARQLALINIGLQQEPEDLRLERRTRLPAIRQSNAMNSAHRDG